MTMIPLLLAVVVSMASAAIVPDGQVGCLFDGQVYEKGDLVIPKGCLSEMTCLGSNVYSDLHLLGKSTSNFICSGKSPLACICEGVCPTQRREVDGQSGCLFDGRVYGPGQDIIIQKCLAKLTCLGNNNIGNEVQLFGDCSSIDQQKRTVDGQSGCLFDGRVYTPGQDIAETGVHLRCLGHNLYVSTL